MTRIPVVDIDFRILDASSPIVIWPVSDEAVAWAEEHLPSLPRWNGGLVLIADTVEHILSGAAEDGLVFGRFAIDPARAGDRS